MKKRFILNIAAMIVVAFIMMLVLPGTTIFAKAASTAELVTDLANLTDGNRYVIVAAMNGKYYALKGEASTEATKGLAYEEVNLVNSKIEGVTDSSIWTLNLNSENVANFKSNSGNFLNHPKSSEIKLDATGSGWKIEKFETDRFTIQSSVENTRYLTFREYTNNSGNLVKIFKAYSNSNLTAEGYCGYLYFYKVTATTTDPVVETSKIADVKKMAKGTENIKVEGIVTFIDGKNVYIEDETGAIDLYMKSAPSVKIGDKVEAIGKLDEYNYLFELVNIDPTDAKVFKIISSNNPLPLKEMTIEELINDATVRDNLCERVIVRGVKLGKINIKGSTEITQNGFSINIYKMPELTGIKENDIIDFKAVLSIFKKNNAPLSQLRIANATDVVIGKEIVDPITNEMFTENVLNIVQANAAQLDTEITVLGQIVYRYGNYDKINTTIIEDVINGKVEAIQIYGSLDEYKIGDIITVTGKRAAYGEVPQISKITATVKVATATAIEPLVFENFTDVLALKTELLSEYIKIKDLTLGAYNDKGNTMVTDKNNVTYPIYRSATYPVGIKEGEIVDLIACWSKYKATYQMRVGFSTNFILKEDTQPPVITVPENLTAEANKDFNLVVEIIDNVKIKYAKISYIDGNELNKEIDLVLNEITGKFECTIPSVDIRSGITKITISITASDLAGNVSNAEAVIEIVDLPRIISVTPAPNTATNAVKRPIISCVYENAGNNPIFEIFIDNIKVADSDTFTPQTDMIDGKHTVKIIITREDKATCQYEWVFTIGEAQYGIYFGQLHSHTAQYSDGSGTLKQAYEHAMNAPNVDFLAVTDHSNYFDTKTNFGDMGDPTKGTMGENGQTKWQEALATADYYDSLSSDFVALYGYEMTWSGQYGHMNTFNTEGFVSRNNPTYTVKGGAGLTAYYDLLKQYPNSISQFNHPGTTFGTFDDFAHYDVGADKMITMIEVGNGEGAVDGKAYWPSYEYYTLALDKGWHLAPTNNQDNHKGNWGDSNTARSCVITDNFTREGIYQAMRDMSMYATEDNDLRINYFLNDQKLGSIIPEKPENVHIYANLSDGTEGENVGKVSVIVNGGVVAYSQEINANSGIIDIELPCNYSYYYLRVDQADGNIAVTAPVWTGEVTKVGITSVEKDTAMDVKGEAINFTTKLYNYENAAMSIDRIEYSVDGLELAVESNLGVLDTGKEKAFNFQYTPTKLGAQTFTTTVFATLNGVGYKFVYNFKLEILDSAELINIAIDYGHSNFYVSGNYANSDAALIDLFGKNAIRSHYIKEDITYDAIKDMKMLILTVPFVGFGTVGAENLYTPLEIAAIKQYADNGGNLIVCSKSDRGNPEQVEEHADVISNGILEAIGAKARIGNGIIVDNVEKANEAYRLSFTKELNYNYSNPFVKDVLETTNNNFSCYNGAPVIANGADIVLKGYSTTWGASYTENFGGSSSYVPDYAKDKVVVPMGDVVVMTSETLPGGGWLLTSGVTFFSTFEVKVEIENATTLQNSNYQIVMNIIDILTPDPVITEIKKIHEAEEGVKFTVEGIVTSNSSGYDKNTAFFDCIYIQDSTGGLNLFPVDGNFKIGQKVRVTGVTSSYNGERQLKVSKINIIDETVNAINPLEIAIKDVDLKDYLGMLLKVNGVVSKLVYSSDGSLDTIFVKDNNGNEVRVFIDGYIMSEYKGLEGLKVGDKITAIGLRSVTVDTQNPESGYITRLRVRNRSEITFTQDKFYNITTEVKNGEITVNPSNNILIKNGESVTVKFTMDRKYVVKNLIIDGRNVGSATEWTFENVNENHTIVVECALYDESITPSCKSTVIGSIGGNGSGFAIIGLLAVLSVALIVRNKRKEF
ncbi:MAG: CehA/McbA family metallohydrolase [Clostridia bacterium]